MQMKNKLFDESEKSTFKYWFWHWYWYNKVAKEWGVWKFKYLFHDIEKPFMRLFLPYEKVRKWHRSHNRHHLSYPDKTRIDWMALIIDWECSMYSKKDQTMNAYSYSLYMMSRYPNEADLIMYNVLTVLSAIGKDKPYNRDEDGNKGI